jgi:hypothetical protein
LMFFCSRCDWFVEFFLSWLLFLAWISFDDIMV